MTSIGERLGKGLPGRGADQKATDSDTSHEKRSKKKIELLKRLAAIGIISSGIVGAFLGIGGSLEGRASDASDPEDGGGDGKPGESLGGADINPLDQDLVAVPSSTPPRRPTQAPTISRPTQTPTENPVRITPTAELMTERELLAQWRESSYANFLELSSDEINRQLQIIQENLPDEYRVKLMGVKLENVYQQLEQNGYTVVGYDFSTYGLRLEKDGEEFEWYGGLGASPSEYAPTARKDNGVVGYQSVLRSSSGATITFLTEIGSTFEGESIAVRVGKYSEENADWFFESFQQAIEQFHPEVLEDENYLGLEELLREKYEVRVILLEEDLTKERDLANGMNTYLQSFGLGITIIPGFSEDDKDVVLIYITVEDHLNNSREGAPFDEILHVALERVALQNPNLKFDYDREFNQLAGKIFVEGAENYSFETHGGLVYYERLEERPELED